MPKTVALQSRMEHIAALLQARGYTVIDMYEASRPGTRVDAFLFTSNHPDILTSYNNLTSASDITIGNTAPSDDELSTVMVNVTGLSPDEALAILEQKFSLKNS